MSKLVLIDGNSIANRAFYALPLLVNKQGIYTNSVYGFTQILLRILEDIKPDYILVAFDAGKTTFRHKDYKEYKGKRLKTPNELSCQFPLIKELLDTLEIKHFELANYEADDIIGTVAKFADERNIDTIIYTGDKDLLQLVTDNVKIYITIKGISEVEVFDLKKLEEVYNLLPNQIIDLKGLMGDASDNIPGVPGVGVKTALKLLHQYHSVEEILDNIDELKGEKLKENLENNRDKAILSKQLATIYKSVPMKFSIEDYRLEELNKENMAKFFTRLGFQTLKERLGLDNLSQEENEDIEEIDIKVYPELNIEEWEEKFQNKTIIALHVEVNNKKLHNKDVLGIVLSDGKEQLYISLDQTRAWKSFIEWLEDENAPKRVFDGKKDEMTLFWENINLRGVVSDVLLSNYLLNPSEGDNELSEIAESNGYCGLQTDEFIYGKGAKWKIPEEEILIKYLARKANAIYNIVPILEKKLLENNLTELLNNIELPLSKVLADMEKSGFLIDIDRLKKMSVEITQRLDDLTKKIYDLAGTEFNINSPKQLSEILFDKLQLPVIKKTKTGYSTDVDVLEKLSPYHSIIEEILNYRQLGKLQSTYIEGLLKMINPLTGKIHTSFNQAVTTTGRLSSTEPNLQNIPIRLEEGRKIRQVFIPAEPDWKILSADYSQIELRVLAHIAGDKNLIEAFNNDKDIHTKTAMDIFSIKEEEVTSAMRRQAKMVNFGIAYGISDYGLSQNLNISRKEAAAFIERYFAIYSSVKIYMEEIVVEAKKNGYVSTLLNRRRYLPEINSPNYNIRSFAERTAINTPIQGSAADIIKIAMVRIYNKIKEKNLKSTLKLQVHDELIFEVTPDEIEIMKILVKETMEGALNLKVPLKVDINIGRTWFEAK